MPSVSIIIPLHNRAGELPQTLESLIAQTCSDWQAIIVDDHSTDGADRVAREYAARDSRIVVHVLPDPKRGAPAARNFGLSKSEAEFVIFLDSDDLFAPTCVERRVAHLQSHQDLDFAVARSALFREMPGDMPFLWNADTGENDLDRLMKSDVPWATAGPIWRKSSLQRLSLSPVVGGEGRGEGAVARGTQNASAAASPNPLTLTLSPEYGGEGTTQVWDESILSGQDWELHIRAVALGLRYDRIDATDCYWRIASGKRDSIGKKSFGKEHALARPAVIDKIEAFLAAHGGAERYGKELTVLRLKAAEEIADRVSRKEGRVVWKNARKNSPLPPRLWKQFDSYLFAKRWPALAEKKLAKIESTWPREYLARRGQFFNCAPADPGRPPAISIVMSVYNNAAYVNAAMKSILTQTFRDFEFIIIDDGSTDGSGALLRRFAESDCRIRLVSRANKGLTVSLNEGVAMARGEFIARMDADDIADRTRFEKQISYLLAHPDVVALGTRIETIDPFDSSLDRPLHKLHHAEIDAELIRGSGWALVHPTVIMRASALKQLGGYREEWNNSEDLDLFLRLAEIGKVANLPEVLLKYRQHLGSVNHQKFERQMKIKRTILEQAHARRGTALPTDWEFKDRREVEPVTQHLFWGWKAHGLGNYNAARLHALQVLKRKPFNLGGLKLYVIAVRDQRRDAKRAASTSGPLAPVLGGEG